MKSEQDSFTVGDLVIAKIKNRWGLECAGIIENVKGGRADVKVWNMEGPGADVLVTGIPFSELIKDSKSE
jgi:hypothetical protein